MATNNYCCFAREYLPFIRLRRLTNKITKEGVCVRECGPSGSSKDQKQTSWKNTMTVRFRKCPRATIHHAASQTQNPPASSVFHFIDETFRNLALFLKYITDVNQVGSKTLRECFRVFVLLSSEQRHVHTSEYYLMMGWRRVQRRRSVVLKHAAAVRKTQVKSRRDRPDVRCDSTMICYQANTPSASDMWRCKTLLWCGQSLFLCDVLQPNIITLTWRLLWTHFQPSSGFFFRTVPMIERTAYGGWFVRWWDAATTDFN